VVDPLAPYRHVREPIVSTVLPTPTDTPRAGAGAGPPHAAGTGATIPWHVSAVVFAALAVQIGVIWDISWHQSIGRDTLFSPPHLAIYVGGVTAGLASAWLVLRTSFAGSGADRAAAVSFWHFFRAPLAAWVCIWGAIAMLTSAPFDDWWHNAYGLDVKILSPPHAVLAAGIIAINIGAMLMVLPLQNRATGPARRRLGLLYAGAAGLLVLGLGTMASEYHYRFYMHGSRFYLVAAIAFPLFLAAAARSTRLRWGATATAAAYSAVTLAMMWILPLFPAEPKLAPIYHQVTRMVAPTFPLLIIVGALCMDWIANRYRDERRDTLLAIAMGGAFFLAFLAAQWLWAYFLMSPWARNYVFGANSFPYQVMETGAYFQRRFVPTDLNEAAMRAGLLKGFVIAMVTTRLGLGLGNWMRRVQR
jgi:hypothetical protein